MSFILVLGVIDVAQGERFRVVRAYPKSLTEVELTCTSEKVDHGEI